MSLFIHRENQELLWNIINKNTLFLQVFTRGSQYDPHDWFKNIIQRFYVTSVNMKLTANELNNFNKSVISFMMNELKGLITPKYNNSANQPNIENSSVSNIMSNMSNKQTNYVETKQELYARQFNDRQNDYNTMLKKPEQGKPEFSENIKDEAISNMDELIKMHKKQREEELMCIAAMPVSNNIGIKIDNNNNIAIKPDNILEDISEKAKKSVSWQNSDDIGFRREFDELKETVLYERTNNNTLVREVNELKSKVLSMEKYMNEMDIRIIRLNTTIDMFSKKGELTENKMQNEQYHTNSFY